MSDCLSHDQIANRTKKSQWKRPDHCGYFISIPSLLTITGIFPVTGTFTPGTLHPCVHPFHPRNSFRGGKTLEPFSTLYLFSKINSNKSINYNTFRKIIQVTQNFWKKNNINWFRSLKTNNKVHKIPYLCMNVNCISIHT